MILGVGDIGANITANITSSDLESLTNEIRASTDRVPQEFLTLQPVVYLKGNFYFMATAMMLLHFVVYWGYVFLFIANSFNLKSAQALLSAADLSQ